MLTRTLDYLAEGIYIPMYQHEQRMAYSQHKWGDRKYLMECCDPDSIKKVMDTFREEMDNVFPGEDVSQS